MRQYQEEHSRTGANLCAEDQREVLAAYVHRSTPENLRRFPHANGKFKDGSPLPLQFASDADWLANTRFAVRLDGRLDRRVRACYSRPTWPNNPELRK